jgi:hypothetical protein
MTSRALEQRSWPTARVGGGAVEHQVKSWPKFFESTLAGVKTHDLRRLHDREYRVGDRMRSQEFDPETQAYTGRELVVEITYVTSAEDPCALSEQAVDPNYCILSIRKVDHH